MVWDVQKMLVDFIFNKEEFMNKINLLIESARKSKIPIFYTTIEMLPLNMNLQQDFIHIPNCLQGSTTDTTIDV